MLHVEPVGPPSGGARLLLQPDFFFGDLGEPRDGRQPAASVGKVASSVIAAPVFLFSYSIDRRKSNVINRLSRREARRAQPKKVKEV